MYTSAQQPQSQGSVEDPFHSLSGLSPAAPAPAQPADASPAGHGVEGGAREFMKLQASLVRALHFRWCPQRQSTSQRLAGSATRFTRGALRSVQFALRLARAPVNAAGCLPRDDRTGK